jgi:hypothetical protein
MAAAKYQKYIDLMKTKHSELFERFKPIHDGFAVQPKKWENEFHTVGRDVLDAAHEWERRLCSGTERGMYAQYSVKLADKFWIEIKKIFPLIDQVGLKVKK